MKSIENLKILFLLIITATVLISCSSDDDNENSEIPQQEIVTGIIGPSGGQLHGPNDINITFPEGAVDEEIEVSLGYTGSEPQTVPNSYLSVISNPFSVSIPLDKLNKPAYIDFKIPSDFSNTDEISFVVFNGETYLPLFYTIENNRVKLKLDVLNFVSRYNPAQSKGVEGAERPNVAGFLIIEGIKHLTKPPSNQMGLKEVVFINNGEISYNEVENINPNDKIAVFIHGLFGAPETWKSFIPRFESKTNFNYTKILTFGYDSSLNIDQNGQSLANALTSKLPGIKVDIIGHSMGGLVSRSAIENHNADTQVNNLITLGSPHKGSPLALARYLVGYLIGQEAPFNLIFYNKYTKGVKDLEPGSNFIQNLETNQEPPVSYYAISAINDPCHIYLEGLCWPGSLILEGDDDGVVSKTSALGIANNQNINLPTHINSNYYMAHMKITENTDFINLTSEYLNATNNTPPIPTDGLVAHYPFNGNANDESGNGNHGIVNGATFVSGVHGLSLRTKGVNSDGGTINPDHVKVSNSTSLEFTNSVSISYWVKIEGDQAQDYGVGCGYDTVPGIYGVSVGKSGDRKGFRIKEFQNRSTIAINHYNNGFDVATSDIANSYQEWRHIVYVLNQDTVKVYVNGQLANEQNGSIDFTRANTQDLYIGAEFNNLCGGTYWGSLDGNIDELRFYNRPLVEQEVLALYNE